MKATRGKFKLAGMVNGTSRENFYKETKFDSGSTKKEVNFGVRTSNDTEVWLKLEAFIPKDLKSAKAKFQKYNKDTKTNDVKEVPWIKRQDFNEKDYYPQFGVSVGLTMDGKNVSKKSYFQLDAIDEIGENLKDGMFIYVEGDVENTNYVNKKGEKTSFRNLKPTKVLLSTKEIDFDSESFEEVNLYEQTIIFIGVEKSEDKHNGQDKFIVESKIVNNKKDADKKPYDEVVDVEMFTVDKQLAQTLKNTKNIKPYNSIVVYGRFVNSVEEEVSTEVDSWGEKVEFKSSGKPTVRELQLISARPSSIDTEIYSEEIIEKAIKAKQDFGKTESESKDSWGSTESESTTEDEDDVWN